MLIRCPKKQMLGQYDGRCRDVARRVPTPIPIVAPSYHRLVNPLALVLYPLRLLLDHLVF